jgi:transcriptional antiterminator NusG
MPGYVLVNMDLTDESWSLVKGTPGVTGFVGAQQQPVPLTQSEVDRLLHREVAVRAPSRAQFTVGESVKVIQGPLSDFSGEISEINEDAGK